jgi:glycerophosphoryl diester phosphodiesterase
MKSIKVDTTSVNPAAANRQREVAMRIYAHRGTSATDPENTLRAFRHAIEVGAGGIELDIHATSDHIPVVIHDRDVARTTNGKGNVDQLPLVALSQLDAGDGERVPTFDAVLNLAGDRIHFDVEIKQAGIEREVLATLARHPNARWAISSFDWDILRAIRGLSPDADLWLLTIAVTDELFTTARELGATALSLLSAAYTPETAARIASAGLDVVIWTVNDVAEAARVRDLGAVGLCTDDPVRIMNGLTSQ